MKYFLHDTNALQDEKISLLFMKFGYEGIGLFYVILEKLALQEKPINTEVLKSQLGVKKRLEKCWSFLEEIGLISSQNGQTFNIKLLNFREIMSEKKQKTKERVSQWREKQKVIKNVTHNEPVGNTPNYTILNYTITREREEAEKNESKIEAKILDSVCYDVEKLFEENAQLLETVCMATNKTKIEATVEIQKCHLHLEKKSMYPMGKKAAVAWVKSWLLNSDAYNAKYGTNSKPPKAKKNEKLPDANDLAKKYS